jgi:transposase
MKKPFRLSVADLAYLEGLLKKGSLKVKIFKRAKGLLFLNESKSSIEIGQLLGVGYQTVSRWRANYQVLGLKSLEDKARSGRPIVISGEQRAKITALACSTPPLGHDRWSLRLLSDKAVELGYVEHLSHNHAGKILKKTNSSPI